MNTEILKPSTAIKTCTECGKDFVLEFVSSVIAQYVTVCPDCSEKHAIEDRPAIVRTSKADRAAAWLLICPPDYQDTHFAKLPSPSLLTEALTWQYGAKGLIFTGETGRGKSRCAWEVAKREFLAGKSVRSINSKSGMEYAAAFSTSAADAEKWVRQMTECDLLLMDDIFKAKLTDSFEAAIFIIISQRTERKKPLIVTTNDTGETLIARMSEDRGAAIVRRLREFCQPIKFTRKP